MGGTTERSVETDVILFYLYKHLGEEGARILAEEQRSIGANLSLVGRVLVAPEGINGTVQGDFVAISKYKRAVEDSLNAKLDWKHSRGGSSDLFPDFVIKEVKEIVSFGLPDQAFGDRPLDVDADGGEHLHPTDFHRLLNETPSEQLVLVDVRNSFEYEIGHFDKAANPGMTHTAQWPQYVEKHLEEFRGKTVMLYCTGGIRCEKASAVLHRRLTDTESAESTNLDTCRESKNGKHDTKVYQLQGGIHRYLEAFPDGGLFRGSNFSFDRRIVQPHGTADAETIGMCSECNKPWGMHHGGRVCCVCRKLVLVCDACDESSNHGEYWCSDHVELRHVYYYFIDRFGVEELTRQFSALDSLLASQQGKNRRATLRKKMQQLEARITELRNAGLSGPPTIPPRRCRACSQSYLSCPGTCWGFWRSPSAHCKTESASGLQDEQVEPLCQRKDLEILAM